MDNLLFKRILVTVLIVALLSYVGFLFYNANFSKSVEIESAVSTTVNDSISTKAFILKNEKYITNDQSGVLSYNVENGEDVNKGEAIADIYSNENDAVSQQKIKDINTQIKNLQNLSKFYFKDSVGLDTINSDIQEKVVSMLTNVNKQEFTDADDDMSNLIYYINEKQIITGQTKNFSSKISQLKSERAKIQNSCSSKIGTLKTDKAGYYVSHADGYENSLDYSKVDDITLNDFNNIKKKSVPSNVVGKVIVSPQWYVLCQVDKDQAIVLSKLQGEDAKVKVSIPAVSQSPLLASIKSINQTNKSKSALVALTCDNMSSQISTARSENVKIITDTYTGLKVSKRAIHESYVTKQVENKAGKTVTKKKKVQGVYVLRGSELVFKQINIVYSSKQYVLCDPDTEDSSLFNGVTVQLYDQIVIKGENLYDGKVIA